jgi:hypothetical protein
LVTDVGVEMSTGADDRRARQSLAEQAALNQLIERLAIQFPELSAEEIARVVREKYAEFGGSGVRTFVPILVGRSVQADPLARVTRASE